MSPQSRMVNGEVYGLREARWLKPRKEVWREEAARIARGPNRAPADELSCQSTIQEWNAAESGVNRGTSPDREVDEKSIRADSRT